MVIKKDIKKNNISASTVIKKNNNNYVHILLKYI